MKASPLAEDKEPLPASTIRLITPQDNIAVAAIIRAVLTEFSCTDEGYAIHDPEVDDMFNAYHNDKREAYFIAECDGNIVGGGGVAQLKGTYQSICELQKFYILPEYRGRGIGQKILDLCLNYARENGYSRCYIETVERMNAAETLYRKAGFEPIATPLGNTGHHACDRWYVRAL